jgi:hypothetical protein
MSIQVNDHYRIPAVVYFSFYSLPTSNIFSRFNARALHGESYTTL